MRKLDIAPHIFLRCRGSFFEKNDASNRAHVFLLWFCRSDKHSRRISPAFIICGGKIITLGCLHDLKYPKNWERNWTRCISTHWMYVTLLITSCHFICINDLLKYNLLETYVYTWIYFFQIYFFSWRVRINLYVILYTYNVLWIDD